MNHGELARRAALRAALLQELGLRPGDRLALFMYNGLELATLYVTCFLTGIVAVPLNTRYKAPEAEHAIRLTGARAVLADQELGPVLSQALPGCPEQPTAFTVHQGRLSPLGGTAAPDIPDQTPADILDRKLDAHDPAVILFTSGSTGAPKGVVHTQGTLGHHLDHVRGQGLRRDDVGLAATHICHVSGLAGILLPMLALGGACVMLKDYEPGEYIRQLNRHRATFLILLPTMLLDILEHSSARDADFSHVQSMLVSGDKVPQHTYELYRNLTGTDLLEGCAMTECMGYCLQPPDEPKKPGAIGKPVAGMEIRITDSEGQDLPDGEIGEFRLKSDAMFVGYWQNPEATREVMLDGWFRTGDLGRRDGDGFYHFTGRVKDLIVRGGSNISSVEVEVVLVDHPAVDQCGVVGIPDGHWGEVVGAFIQLKLGADRPSDEDIRAFVAKRLADYMLPERIVFVDRLPRNATGKLDRHGLRDMVRKLYPGKAPSLAGEPWA